MTEHLKLNRVASFPIKDLDTICPICGTRMKKV